MPTAEDPVVLIARATAGEIGTEFLTALVRSMHTAMDVSIAFITRGIGEPPVRARTSYSWKKEGFAFPDEYDLEGTPCRLVYNGQHILVPEQLWQAFPKEVGREGYCGVPLKATDNRVVGHFSVISDTPIREPERAESVLRLFAMRIEAEWQRLEREVEREDLIGRLGHAIARLGHQHQAIRRANQFKSEMLGMVAHDLRGPLSVIVGRAELIDTLFDRDEHGKSMSQAQQVRKSSAAIGQAAGRMERMIADLLASARDDAMSIQLERRSINLADPARVAIGLNHASAEAKRLRVLAQLEDALVYADEDKLVEAIDNLLSNAVKYSEAGSTIAMSIRTERESGHARIIVSDQGQGMDADDLDRAFQRFQQLSAKPTRAEASTGLGLAIVKSIAEAHGGSVSAQSAGKGLGSTFTLHIPLACGGG